MPAKRLPYIAELAKKEVFNRNDFPDTILYYTSTVPWESMFRRDFIQQNDITFHSIACCDDVCFTKCAYALAERITAIDQIFVYHRCGHIESEITNIEKVPINVLIANLTVKKELQKRGVFEAVKNSYALYAISNFRLFFNRYRTSQAFSQLFDALRDEYIESLELETALTNDLVSFGGKQWIRKIKSGDKFSYVFELKEQSKKEVFHFGTDVIFPRRLVHKTERVILYGAGNIGTGFYLQNMKENYCEIVAWIDKNPEGKQIPIQGLDALQTVLCDKVLVAIDGDNIFREVKTYLLDLGFRSEQIVKWDTYVR